ncbi:unnamed protein product [Pleuronectes platessa]|uniref:Uncharacterized protein n=1 Tax=Pleuronectes platessa TaxID=8262 RepID=A0A9N7YCH8_PLEPL|nr:unnamed protein product [Pleuronectes platessa]
MHSKINQSGDAVEERRRRRGGGGGEGRRRREERGACAWDWEENSETSSRTLRLERRGGLFLSADKDRGRSEPREEEKEEEVKEKEVKEEEEVMETFRL